MRITFDRLTKRIDGLSCACYACSNEIQEGHVQCNPIDPAALRLEQDGFLSRTYENPRWWWVVINPSRLVRGAINDYYRPLSRANDLLRAIACVVSEAYIP